MAMLMTCDEECKLPNSSMRWPLGRSQPCTLPSVPPLKTLRSSSDQMMELIGPT